MATLSFYFFHMQIKKQHVVRKGSKVDKMNYLFQIELYQKLFTQYKILSLNYLPEENCLHKTCSDTLMKKCLI